MAPSPVVVVAVTVPMSLNLLGRRLSLMADRGWQVHLVVGQRPPDNYSFDPRLSVHVIPMKRAIAVMSDAVGLLRWISLLRRVRPDCVVGATPKAAFLAMLASRATGVRYRIFEMWGARWDGAQGRRRTILQATDRLTVWAATETIAVSQSLAELLDKERITRSRATVLGHGSSKGVDLDLFGSAKSGNARSVPVIGFVGRLAFDKGLHDLRAVFELLQISIPGVQLHVAGSDDSADPLDQLTQSWLSSGHPITLRGSVEDIPDFLHEIDVLCFPSHREGLPNAVIEAAAAEVPSVAWAVTGCSDAILDGATGFLVPLGQHERMAERLGYLLTDQSVLRTMGHKARKGVADRFNSTEVQAEYVSHLAKIMTR